MKSRKKSTQVSTPLYININIYFIFSPDSKPAFITPTPTKRVRLRNCATAGGPSTKSAKGIQGILNGSRICGHQVAIVEQHGNPGSTPRNQYLDPAWYCGIASEKVWKNKGKWILTLDKYAFSALTRGNIQYLPRTQMTSCLIGKCLHLKTFQAPKIEDKQVSGRKIAGFGVKAPPFTFNTFRIEFWSHGKSCLPPSWPPIWKETNPLVGICCEWFSGTLFLLWNGNGWKRVVWWCASHLWCSLT